MKLTDADRDAVQAFRNFLGWGALPARPGDPSPERDVPPAWWAYAFGVSTWCPPAGEL